MKDRCPNAQSSMAELLERCPEVIPVLLRHNMACVGCLMSPFETLQGAAAVYHLPLDTFMQELREAIDSTAEAGPALQ